MCKACKMDPHEVAAMRQRQGAVGVDDFYKEVNYTPKSKKKAKRKRNYPGCVGNDGGPHIYVWTTEGIDINYLFYRYFGYHKKEAKTCCGCGKMNGSRNTERYEKEKLKRYTRAYGDGTNQPRGEPVPKRYIARRTTRKPNYRYWSWESSDEGYQDYRRDYINRHGFTSVVWGDWCL